MDVTCLPVLFELVELLSCSKRWWSNLNELIGGCWTDYLTKVFLVGWLFSDLFCLLFAIGVSKIILSCISLISDLYTSDMKW